jgi:hypothetical protein
MREEGIYLSLVGSKEARDVGIVGSGGLFPGIQRKVDTSGKGPMREEGISIYLSLVGARKRAMQG